IFFFSSRRRHTRCLSDWSSDVCSSDLTQMKPTKTTKGATARFWCLHLITAMLLMFTSAAFGVSGKGKYGPHAAPDLDKFPVNPDGTVSVIVQLAPGTPPGQVKQFARSIN